MSFRKALFWLHLITGLIAGLVIGILCFTGTALAFEKQIVAWFERDARQIPEVSLSQPRLDFDELARRVRTAFPDSKPASVVINRDPQSAVAFVTGRTGNLYANPYTGEVRRPRSETAARFMQTMVTWHRYLGFSGDQSRPQGKLATGIANLAFTGLALTGLILWCPRSFSLRALRPGIWFTQNSSRRGRDWNWHNVIGFWSAPVLIALTLTALPISFRWAASFTYTLTGTTLPASGPESSGAPPPVATVPTPSARATPATRDRLLQVVQSAVPAWETITFRLAQNADPARPQPFSFTVREKNTWPRTATTTLQFDPFTGEILRRDGYADLSSARKIRAWSRYLHTGEALGWMGQLLAGLATIGACFLVYTGMALAWRRFFGKRAPAPEST